MKHFLLLILTTSLIYTSFAQEIIYNGNLKTDALLDIAEPNKTSPAFADIDKDGDLDLFIGIELGYIKKYINNGDGTYTADGNLQADGSDIRIEYKPAPEFADIDKDNDYDLYVGGSNGSIYVFTNDGSGNFIASGNLQDGSGNIDVGDDAFPVFADLDKDNDFDLYIGNKVGMVSVFINNGSGNFSADGYLQSNSGNINGGAFTYPAFADIDTDNELDLYIGNQSGYVKEYKNDGTNIFTAGENLKVGEEPINQGSYAKIKFVFFFEDFQRFAIFFRFCNS